MLELQTGHIHCPYCGEKLELVLDPCTCGEVLIEDCQICCRPINLLIEEDASGHLQVQSWREDDVE